MEASGIVGIVSGVTITIIVAFIIYEIQRKEKEPWWDIATNNWFQDLPDGLRDLSYNGESIKNLSVSKVVIWNNGRATIFKRDIDEDNPLKIEAEDNIKILNAKVTITPENKQERFSVSLSDDKTIATISFLDEKYSYLDSHEGIIVQLVHTGTSSAKINTFGKIVDGLKLKRGHLERKSSYGGGALSFGLLGALILGVGLRDWVDWGSFGVGVFIMLLGLFIFLLQRQGRVPAELRQFLNNS